MNKESMVYRYKGILFSHEKEGDSIICDNLDEIWGHYAKWNKSDKDKYYMISLLCGTWKLPNT